MNATAMVFALLAISGSTLQAAGSASGATPEPKACRLEVVRLDHGPSAAKFVAWLRAHREALPDPEYPQMPAQVEVFIADIDNVVTLAGIDGRTAKESEYLLALGSNTIPASQVPAEFWTQMDETLSRAAGYDVKLGHLVSVRAGMGLVYAGPGGRWEDFAMPAGEEQRP